MSDPKDHPHTHKQHDVTGQLPEGQQSPKVNKLNMEGREQKPETETYRVEGK